MVRHSSLVLFVFWAFVTTALSAQQPSPKSQAATSADMAEGRRLFHQKCSLCHLAPVKGEEPYGPRLSRNQVTRSEEGVRAIIRNGVGRMPGFQYTLQAGQIDAIVAFLKTLDVPTDRILIETPNP
jgi:mono/diheme cytochrome c family protein